MNPSVAANETFGKLAHDLAANIIRLLQRRFGPAMDTPIFGNIHLAHVIAALIFLGIILIADVVIFGSLRRWTRREAVPGEDATTWHHVARALSKPLHLLVWVCGIYFVAAPPLLGLKPQTAQDTRDFLETILDFAFLAVVVWLFFRLTHAVENRLRQWAAKSPNKIDDLLVPLFGKCLRVIVPVIAVILVLPALPLPAAYSYFISKISSILIIGAISWVLFQGVNLVGQVVMTKFDINAADNLRAREVFTQITVLKKTLYVVIGVFTIASILMLFEEVRRLGTSILASAGVLGIIVGFAAQKTIANLFAGFQLAMTQPIRIDDVVIVEGEWGRIEEITLTYVVVRIWDLRRLVVPISFFIEKPFQNWTRVSADILGTVFLYTDYTIPVDAIRQELQRILEASPKWDKKVCGLQVTDAKDNTVELRALMSAADASLAWDLRCEVREKLLTFVQKNFPESLPKVRATLTQDPGRELLPQPKPAAT